MWLRKYLAVALILACAACASAARLVWDANTESDLAGYKIHYGLASGQYTNTVDVGNVTTWPIPSAWPRNQNYYFAATAYDNEVPVHESGFSNEAIYYANPAKASNVGYSLSEVNNMAAAIRTNKGTLTNGSRSNSVLPAPSTIVNGDILLAILIVGNSAAPSVTPPAGFSEITGYPIVYGKTDPWYVNIHAFVKVASSESGNYTFTHTTAYSEGIIYAISGADTSSPETPNATNASYTGGEPFSGQTWTAPGLTTSRDGSAVFFVAACWDAAGPTVPPTGTTPTFAEDFDGGSGGVFYAASGILATAGATGNKSTANANASSSSPWGAGLICIQSAGAAGASIVPILLNQYRARRQ